jgi:cytochrome P450
LPAKPKPRDGRTIGTAFDPDHLGREFYDDLYPTYAALRTSDPVHRCPDGSYFLTRHADLDRIYRDRKKFSSSALTHFFADTPRLIR